MYLIYIKFINLLCFFTARKTKTAIYNTCITFLCLCVCVVMEGGPPPPCVPSICHLVNHCVQGPWSGPPICGIAGGSKEGRVNIHVTLMDVGPATLVVCVWFPPCMKGWMNEWKYSWPQAPVMSVGSRIGCDLWSFADGQMDGATPAARQTLSSTSSRGH